jgi:lysophospholipase L1-like esterase
VTDAETIPSFFVRAYQTKYPGGRPIQAVNLAMPSYYSYQELILLADRIFRDDKPDMVIMLDGLNDVFQANASFLRAPVYTPGIGGQIHPVAGDNRLRLPNFFDLPSGISEDSACRIIYEQYLANIRHARDLAAAWSIPLYCFWQPVPYYNYTNRAADPNCTQTRLRRFATIYPLVKKSAGEIPYLFFLGDMLQEEKGLPFIDQIHYSPDFNRAIAQKMVERIRFN